MRLKVIFLLMSVLLFSSLGASFSYAYKIDPEWKEYKSDHFMVSYHPSIPSKYIREFTRKCERYYHLIAERMGFKRFDFWSWENRAKIFVYGSKQDYVKFSGREAWSAASVHVRNKFISTYYFADQFFDRYLPHELTHIVLREFIGFKTLVPFWFEEGLPCANEDDCYVRYLLVAKGLVDKNTHFSVPELEGLGRGALKHQRKFYSMAASVVIFLLEEFGKDQFVRFCRELRDGEAFYSAMNKVYRIGDYHDLNGKFLIFLSNKSYEDIATAQNTNVNW
ncbi:peptidase MA family metallohydrolase [Candidatus Omnitrophota bacterium]